jgi:hypothetical protein
MGVGVNLELGNVFEGIGNLAIKIREAITGKVSPEKEAEILQHISDLEHQANMAQTKINEIEAASPNLFVSGARPAAMWICVIGFAYSFLIQPFLAWASFNFGWVAPPIIDATILINLLLAMLGLGGFRTWEKIRGVARN